VTASTGSGDGTLGLDLVDDDSITDTAGNPLAGAGNGSLSGELFTLDRSAPTVLSIVRAGTSPTNAASVDWTVTFSESVSGVDAGDFSLAVGGLGGSPTISLVAGSGTTWTVTASTGSGDGTLGLDLVDDDSITDTAGNPLAGAGNGSLSGELYALDRSAPTVTGVSSTTADGAYGVGASIAIQVTFSEAVTVAGIPTLTLTTGSPATTSVDYTGGSGTSTLTFTYVVAAGNSSADLDYPADTALDLNGGSIRDAALNNAALVLAAPAASGSLAANKDLVIDTTAPTVINVTSSKANGTYAAGTSIPIQVTFSEVVNVVTTLGTPKLTLETGAVDVGVFYTSGSGTDTLNFFYLVSAGQISPDLSYVSTAALALNGGTIQDAALNNATVALPVIGAAGSLSFNKALVISLIAPVANAPEPYFTAPSTLGTTTIPVSIKWPAATAPFGRTIASYTLARSVNGGAFSVVVASTTALSSTQTLTVGTTYRFEVKATDSLGSASSYALGPTFKLVKNEDNSGVVYTGSWSTSILNLYSPGTATAGTGSDHYTTISAASASFTFTGRGVAWLSALGTTRGSAQVYLDNVLISTVSLNGATTYRRVLYVNRWATAGVHTIKIVNLATSGHPRIDVDAFLTFQ
jgi:hypothetical protein